MPWYDVVLNTVKVVSQTVTAIVGPTLDLECHAVPYNKRPWGIKGTDKASGSQDTDEDGEDVSSDEESRQSTSAAARITTRARVTYELDRFKKNAMLMFVQIRSDLEAGSRVADITMQEVNDLLLTFTSFKFEVDTYIDLKCGEIETKCHEFFQRDFCDYGAVIVVVLSFEGSNGNLSALDGRFSESVVLRHLTTDLNPSLLAKPKIFITEANRSRANLSGGRTYSLPIEDHHQDVLALHIPALFYEEASRRPLLIFCDNINQMGDSEDFVSIVSKTVKDATETYKSFREIPIELSKTFSKEMILSRS